MSQTNYDIIISGGGMAGLSAVWHLLNSSMHDQRILLVDKERKYKNDRTFCFWETKAGLFEPVVKFAWDSVYFHSNTYNKKINIAPYQYKMIIGNEFYDFVNEKISQAPNVHTLLGDIESVSADGSVKVAGKTYTSNWVLNSVPFQKIDKDSTQYLDQHFKGWIIETEEDIFDTEAPVMMDFRIPQHEETRFLYVLPFSSKKALVEVAIFSNNHLTQAGYDDILKDYISKYILTAKQPYDIVEEEYGVIPMTDFKFDAGEGKVINIGTAGGHTKASSGYTFYKVQQFLQEIIPMLAKDINPLNKVVTKKPRFSFYDSILLNVMLKNRVGIDKAFSSMFKNNPPPRLLGFLNEETNFFQEVQVMRTAPIIPFTKALPDYFFG